MTRKVTHQLTIRFDDALARKLRDHAKTNGVSMNKAAIRLLQSAVGLDDRNPRTIGNSLDHLFGGWTTEEADEFDRFIKEAFGQIDPEMWK
jgi:hypothetical protein